eukprot:4106881-Prymnesium_polylepis.2
MSVGFCRKSFAARNEIWLSDRKVMPTTSSTHSWLKPSLVFVLVPDSEFTTAAVADCNSALAAFSSSVVPSLTTTPAPRRACFTSIPTWNSSPFSLLTA